MSLVLPVHNGQAFIAEAIDSVLAQAYPALEIIVVDDGSTDDTPAILDRYADRLTVIRQANAGQSAALAAGWARAGGTFLGYLSADDTLRPGAVAAVAAALAGAPDAVLAYPDFGLIDERSAAIGVVHAPDYDEARLVGALHCLPGPGALFRRDAYARTGPWDPTLRQVPDLDFFLRLAVHGRFVHVAEVLADYRRHGGATTYRPAPAERADEPVRMVRAFFRRPDLPERIRRYERTATANALILSGGIHGTSRRAWRAFGRFAGAFLTSPRTLFTRRAAGFVARAIAARVRRRTP